MSPEVENEPKKEGLPKSGLRTMVGDAQAYIKDKSFSLAELVARRKGSEAIHESPVRGRFGRQAIYAGLAVLILVLITGGVFWLKNSLVSETPAPEAPKPFIPSAKNLTLKIPSIRNRQIFITEWEKLFNLQLLPREFADVKILDQEQNKFLGASDFFRLIEANPPTILIESLKPEATFGLADVPRGTEPVFIFQAKSFSSAFAGMLAWENNLPKDFQNALSKRTSLDRGENIFKDMIIANNDARFLYNRDLEPILGYAVFNRRFLIIAQSPVAVEIAIRQLGLFPPK